MIVNYFFIDAFSVHSFALLRVTRPFSIFFFCKRGNKTGRKCRIVVKFRSFPQKKNVYTLCIFSALSLSCDKIDCKKHRRNKSKFIASKTKDHPVKARRSHSFVDYDPGSCSKAPGHTLPIPDLSRC